MLGQQDRDARRREENDSEQRQVDVSLMDELSRGAPRNESHRNRGDREDSKQQTLSLGRVPGEGSAWITRTSERCTCRSSW